MTGGLWMKRPAWESVLEEMGNPIVGAAAGLPTGWRPESPGRFAPPSFAGREDPPRTPPRRRFAPRRPASQPASQRARDFLHSLSDHIQEVPDDSGGEAPDVASRVAVAEDQPRGFGCAVGAGATDLGGLAAREQELMERDFEDLFDFGAGAEAGRGRNQGREGAQAKSLHRESLIESAQDAHRAGIETDLFLALPERGGEFRPVSRLHHPSREGDVPRLAAERPGPAGQQQPVVGLAADQRYEHGGGPERRVEPPGRTEREAGGDPVGEGLGFEAGAQVADTRRPAPPGEYTRRMLRCVRRRLAVPAAAAGFLLVAGSAVGQPFAQLGSSSEWDGARNEWAFGAGYDFDFPALPFTVGVLGQTGTGITDGDAGRQFPARGWVTAKMGMLPTPGFRVYLGAGAGVSTRLGGETESAVVSAGMGLAGFQVGRLHMEVQLQRDFGEEPVTRWVTAVGLSF